MTISDRNKWVSIVDDQKAPGAGGSQVTTTVDIVPGTWAAIWPVKSSEARENMRVGSTVTHNIRILYRAGIKADMRVVYGSRSFEIKGQPINHEENNVYLDLVCEEQF